MKKGLLFVLSLCVWGSIQAQDVPQPPVENNYTHKRKIRNFIQENHNTVPSVSEFRPYSYIMRTDEIKTYFNSQMPSDEVTYFHVYFAIDPADVQNKVQLVIVPTLNSAAGGNFILQHDTTFKSVFMPTLYEGGPNFCYVKDKFDPDASADVPCNLNGLLLTTRMKRDIIPWITNYQSKHPNPDNGAGPATSIQSFTFNADLLRSFLVKSGNDIPALQIYIGKDNSLQTPTNNENYTLIFIGLDLQGNHIPVAIPLLGAGMLSWLDNRGMAYEACRPCPKCGVFPESGFDNPSQPQATKKVIERDRALINSKTALIVKTVKKKHHHNNKQKTRKKKK